VINEPGNLADEGGSVTNEGGNVTNEGGSENVIGGGWTVVTLKGLLGYGQDEGRHEGELLVPR